MKVSFVVPFHNEEKNCIPMIKRVMDFVKANKLNAEIIPVDDKSSDETKILIQKTAKKYPLVKPIYRRNLGEEKGNTMGKALVDGTKKASGEIIIWTMGDMADDTKTYLDIINKIKKGSDMVFGSRYIPGGSRGNLDRLKAFLSSWGTRLAIVMFSVPVHDITNAFRGFKKDVFDNITLESPGFSISPEFAIKAHLAGYKLAEVPTTYTNRIEGVSNFKLYNMTKSYLKLFLSIFYRYKIQNKKLDFVIKTDFA